MTNRIEDGNQGEITNKVFFQSKRVQCINGQWFFSVREQFAPLGPFENREDTVLEVELYLRDIRQGVSPSISFLMHMQA